MHVLWKDEIKGEKVLLFINNGVSHKVKTAQGLNLFYPKMILVMCLAHAFNRLAKEIRKNSFDVDKLISTRTLDFSEIALMVPE